MHTHKHTRRTYIEKENNCHEIIDVQSETEITFVVQFFFWITGLAGFHEFCEKDPSPEFYRSKLRNFSLNLCLKLGPILCLKFKYFLCAR